MAKLHVKQIGLLTELKTDNPEWVEYTAIKTYHGEISKKTFIDERKIIIRTCNIIAIES